jgi:hypothetical protein
VGPWVWSRAEVPQTFHKQNMPITNPFASENEMDQMCGGFQLTRMQRMYAFGFLFGIGFVLSFISTLILLGGNLGGFAALYTFGNILSLVSTGFLIGFVNQFKKMFDSDRILATGLFLGSMVVTLISAFVLKWPVLTLLFCIIQYFALLWYSISYIPFARDFVKSIFSKCF